MTLSLSSTLALHYNFHTERNHKQFIHTKSLLFLLVLCLKITWTFLKLFQYLVLNSLVYESFLLCVYPRPLNTYSPSETAGQLHVDVHSGVLLRVSMSIWCVNVSRWLGVWMCVDLVGVPWRKNNFSVFFAAVCWPYYSVCWTFWVFGNFHLKNYEISSSSFVNCPFFWNHWSMMNYNTFLIELKKLR